jgi:hypothetical protein
MAIIGWHNKPDSWVVAGWVFRQLLEDVCSQRPADSEVVSELELAKDLKYLFIDSVSASINAATTDICNPKPGCSSSDRGKRWSHAKSSRIVDSAERTSKNKPISS